MLIDHVRASVDVDRTERVQVQGFGSLARGVLSFLLSRDLLFRSRPSSGSSAIHFPQIDWTTESDRRAQTRHRSNASNREDKRGESWVQSCMISQEIRVWARRVESQMSKQCATESKYLIEGYQKRKGDKECRIERVEYNSGIGIFMIVF